MSLSNVSTTNPLFVDPVTYDVMEDPVVCDDGHTYDRATAQKMSTSPFTRAPLTIVADNVDLRGAIFEANPDVCASYTKHKALATEVRPPSPVSHAANGYGVKTSPKGAMFKGELTNGQLNGVGEWRSARGSIIRGMFQNDMAEGYAEASYSDGRYYIGEYHRGKLHGRGYLRYPNGYVYEGEFQNGQKHGSGVETLHDGVRFTCTMNHNRLMEFQLLE